MTDTNDELAEQVSAFDAGRTPCPQGGEDRWSARWLMQQMGYDTWENFAAVIERAKTAAHNEGFNIRTLFHAVTKKTGGRPQTDYLLTRFAAYLVAMNGHPGKPEVAAAQTYFAVRTREAELTTRPPALSGPELLAHAVLEAQRMLGAKDAEIGELTAKVEADAPKVEAYERFIEADGTYAVGTVAKLLGLSQNKLFDELRGRGLLIAKGPMQNTPTRVLPSGVKFIADRLGRPVLVEAVS